MKITIDQTITQDVQSAIQREWLETNGIGGWASSSILGMNTRRYHGLLVAALHPPVGRMVLLSKLDETVKLDGRRFELATNQYPGAVNPQGFNYLHRFEKEFFPVFEYHVDKAVIRKTIVAVNGENTTLILYEVIKAPGGCSLELQPFVAFRDYHSLMHINDAIRREGSFENGIFRVRPYDDVPELFISLPGTRYSPKPDWYRSFEYPVEQYRGLDFQEDLFTYGVFELNLVAGSKFGVIVSTEDPIGRDAFQLAREEKNRREWLLESLPVKDGISKRLALAAEQFIVRRGDDFRTIIAGYHWFNDWGRDTMIALPGITLVTGWSEDARKILQAFAAHVNQGMLPNRFPDADDDPEYNTVDATLWFFISIYKYLQYSKDENFVRVELMPVLRDIIDWHDRGTHYNIHVDTDGLLYAGEPGVQLTWMDAKIGDWVVTPRQGKAVEINALWYNVLKIYAYFSKRFGQNEESEHFENRADKVRKRFNELFWYKDKGYLYDFIDNDLPNNDIRPNQIFSLSLPYRILPKTRESSVLKIVEEKLLTPMGLRSLEQDHPAYRAVYGGDQYSRDSAYHQGTVWGWLMGPFITALVRVRGAAGISQARKLIENMLKQISEAGIGTISEIFDGDEPHTPRGAIAQAWSVSELLRAYLEDINGVLDKNIKYRNRHK